MLPIRTNIWPRRTPYANYALVAITVVAFVLTYESPYQSYGKRGVASTITSEAQILQLVPQAWRFWQFVTYAFLHGGYWHIIGNMFFLYLFGNNVNDRLGNGPYVLFYLLGAVLSGVGHVMANPASSVPTVGASGAVAAVTGAYFVLFPRSLVTVLYFFFLFFGTVELPAWLRLFAQVAVGVILVAVGIGIATITNPFGGYIPLDEIRLSLSFGTMEYTLILFSALFTIAWVVLIVNTMNWLDGIPGLVSGITVLGSSVLFFLSISDLVNQPEIATMAIIVAMMALAFWLFDFFPPKILLGDSGSMFFGLLLAVLAIFSGGKIATTFLILGFAILDALYVIVYRIYNRKAPWKGGEWDKYRKAVHLHHRMLQIGFSERQVLIAIYVLSAIFGIIALFLGTFGKFWAIVALALASIVLGMILRAKRKK